MFKADFDTGSCPLAQMIGKLVASFPGVLHGRLYYWDLENNKTVALAKNKGNFDAKTILSKSAISELRWWHSNVMGF